jgi:hypothetical protein
MESGLKHDADVVSSSDAEGLDWENTALIVWQASLPEGLIAEELERFVDSGRVIMFFPPGQNKGGQIFDSSWGKWQTRGKEDQRKLSWWRGDADLLANVGSGDALPLNELRIYRYCSLEKSDDGKTGTPLAKLADDQPLLMRAATDRGAVYFCSTLPSAQFSSLERDAVSFYVMLQRAITIGSRSMAAASQRDANVGIGEEFTQYETVAPVLDAPTVSERGIHAGVYRDGDHWIAINRSLVEDNSMVATVITIDQLFDGLSYQRIDDAVGNTSSLASEVWRIFLVLMALALILEAVLCLPEKKVKQHQWNDFSSTDRTA